MYVCFRLLSSTKRQRRRTKSERSIQRAITPFHTRSKVCNLETRENQRTFTNMLGSNTFWVQEWSRKPLPKKNTIFLVGEKKEWVYEMKLCVIILCNGFECRRDSSTSKNTTRLGFKSFYLQLSLSGEINVRISYVWEKLYACVECYCVYK